MPAGSKVSEEFSHFFTADRRLEPGEETDVSVMGVSSAGAFPAARDQLCAAGEVTVVLDYQADQQPDDPLDPPLMALGNATTTTMSVTCD